jgi:cyclopropane-fatty-acyl-phospholipid synthase
MMEEAVLSRIGESFRQAGVNAEVEVPSGERFRLGEESPRVSVHIRTRRAFTALATLNENAIAEAYLDGGIEIEGSFQEALRLRSALNRHKGFPWVVRFVVPLLTGQTFTNRKAIARHYEMPPDFYLSFLDPVWPAYSQGVFEHPDDSLSAAIEHKFELATAACRIGPDSRVIEVGPGWGAYLRYLQLRGFCATALVNSSGLKSYLDHIFPRPQIEVEEGDFLAYHPRQRFSALTMMGVLEHLPCYRRVCRQIRRVLEPGARAFVDACASTKKYEMAEFIYRHIFPYNHTFMHLEGFLKAARDERLEVISVDDDTSNYGRTVTRWAENLERRREEVEARFGSYHFRRFRLFLWGSSHAFENGLLQCYRLVLGTPA